MCAPSMYCAAKPANARPMHLITATMQSLRHALCSSEMHEATRRTLGVLLRQLDGFAQVSKLQEHLAAQVPAWPKERCCLPSLMPELSWAVKQPSSQLVQACNCCAQGSRTVVLAATNRKQDLDPALLSRFDASIAFELPTASTRCASGQLAII